ncbi:hypothetical protein LIER_12841 [Lithospermum erythrorhizon]|uniref:Uncharacterized protein n=1 Tax=Lithospermum erythrorhizon TaxID=34254 RepID=A0AAV3PT95_LITER
MAKASDISDEDTLGRWMNFAPRNSPLSLQPTHPAAPAWLARCHEASAFILTQPREGHIQREGLSLIAPSPCSVECDWKLQTAL